MNNREGACEINILRNHRQVQPSSKTMVNMALRGDGMKAKKQSWRTSSGSLLIKSRSGYLLLLSVLFLGRVNGGETDIFSTTEKKYQAPTPSKGCVTGKAKGSCKDGAALPPTFDPWWGDNKPDFNLPSKQPTPSPTRVGETSPPPMNGPSIQPTTEPVEAPIGASTTATPTMPTPTVPTPTVPTPTTIPTLRPTSTPVDIPTSTFEPTILPRPTITRFPTVSPRPSIVSVASPSTEPNVTGQPVIDETASPTSSNTDSNTNPSQVSIAPGSNPTNSPTISRNQGIPTPAPFVEAGSNTAIPSQPQQSGETPRCTIIDGSFGATFGDRRRVVFGYEVETDPDLQNGPFDLDVLPALEDSMTQFLLPVLFPRTCSVPSAGGDTTATARSGTTRRRLEVFGVSSQPTDQISPTVECQELLVATNNCNFLEGQLTFNYVLRPGETVESFVRLVLERLRFGMDSDAFLDAHPSIKRVSFIVDLDDIPDTVAPTNPNEDRDITDDDDSLEWWPWLLVGSVLFIVCCGILCFRLNSARPPSSAPPQTASERDRMVEDLPETT